MEKKKLVVNCVSCDMRNITKNLLESYEEIEINAASVLSSAETNELMAGYPITINSASVISVPANANLMQVNGRKEIRGAEIEKPTMVTVNGSLEITRGAEESLKNIISMVINGRVIYPSTLEGKLPPMKVNGQTVSYPGDAIRMKATAVIDKVFLLRAKPEKYYAEKRVLILDKDLDLSMLNEKTQFVTKKAYVTESLLTDAVCHFDDETDIEVVADGCTYVNESIRLDKDTLRRYGKKLLVFGDVIIEDAAVFEQTEYLNVNGKVLVADALLEKLTEKKVIYKECQVVKGALIYEKEVVTIDQYFMEKYTDGVTIVDCDSVEISEETEAEWIEKHVRIYGCDTVTCTKEQKLTVEVIATDVNEISTGTEEMEEMEEADEDDKKYEGWKVVDTSEYVF